MDGTSKSCGCLAKELTSKMFKRYNEYDLESKQYGIGYTSTGKEFWFDKEDYERIKEHCWREDNKGYIRTTLKDGTCLFLHSLIMNVYDTDIDHIHGRETTFDNRKENLRVATHSQNQINKGIRKNNTSGVTGVTWNSRESVWVSYIGINKKNIYLGRFTNKEDAIAARKEAEEKYFGEWSYDNSQAI